MNSHRAVEAGSHRLSQVLVAFPLAALIGFGGSVAARAVHERLAPPEASRPGPARSDSDRPAPPERPSRPVDGHRVQIV